MPCTAESRSPWQDLGADHALGVRGWALKSRVSVGDGLLCDGESRHEKVR